MLLTFDKTNFPLLVVERASIEIHLLPVTKVQFEPFVAETGELNQARYKKMLALNPRLTPERFSLEEREYLFVAGILPEEALAFARWLGPGFDLPTVKEWRTAYTVLGRTFLPHHDLSSKVVDGPAGLILDQFCALLEARTMREFSLLHGGLVEWVHHGRSWVGLGAPRPKFHAHLWDPLTHEIKPIRPDERLPYFGFRLVRRGEHYLADRKKVRYVY